MEPDFTGNVAVCSTGRVGLVTGQEEVVFASGDKKKMWVGIGLDGKGLWCSSSPVYLYETIHDYIDRLKKCLQQPGAIYPPLGCGSRNPVVG